MQKSILSLSASGAHTRGVRRHSDFAQVGRIAARRYDFRKKELAFKTNPFSPGSIQFTAFNQERFGYNK